jgi:glutathione S-transferase
MDDMPTLFQHPFCPHSRFVRLIFAELGLPLRLVDERVWDRRPEFLALNPAGTTPVLVEEGTPPIPGVSVIAEYLCEILGDQLAQLAIMPREPSLRIEIRRLMHWFNDKFFEEVSGLLVRERIYKRYIPSGRGGGSPDSDTLRAARSNIRYHLAYIGWLVRTRDWLAGDSLTFADLAAAGHLSVADYLGEVPWDEDESAKNWYARIKSRPSFRMLLTETLAGLPASPSYANLDF